jgi:ectoine hydroxylase-related dioxygenase (phytanoyl-CoA dioxygenase family)
MSNNGFYGAVPQSVISSDLERCLEELALRGVTVLENVVAEPELEVLRRKLDAAYLRQQTELPFDLEEIQEENQVRAPLCYDDAFVEMARHEQVLGLIRAVLGNYFLVHLQIGIINQPLTNNRQSVWHRDLLYQDFVISKPLAVTVMLCLDDFTPETGGTVVVPFTHRAERMPSREYIEKHAEHLRVKAGSMFFMDSMLIHKAGYNSSGRVRRGLNTIYASGLLKQQVNLPSQLGGRFRDDPLLNMLLGYDAEPSASVAAWRRRRYDKLHK